MNLLNVYDLFSSLIKFDPVKVFNEESDYSDENTSDTEDFRSTILESFQLEPEQKKSVLMRAMREKLNLFTLQLPIYSGTLENKAREIDCLCFREVEVMLYCFY